MKQAPGALYNWKWKEGATKIEFDYAKASLSELEADDLVLGAKTPPAPYYPDGDGIGAGEAEWYAPGDEPSGWVSRGGPDNCPEASNAEQTDTDADGIGDA